MWRKDGLFTGRLQVIKEFKFMSDKVVKYLVSILFPAATLYACWWLALAVGEIAAVIAFALLGANYYWLMRKIGRSDK